MKSINHLKRTCSLFKHSHKALLRAQAMKGFVIERTYDATDYIDIGGTEGLICIVEGALDIMEMSEAGNLMLVEHFEKGSCIGANTLFSTSKTSDVIGRTFSDLEVVIIHKDGVFDMLHKDKQFLKDFLELISKRSTMLTRKISSLSFKSLEEKIMNFLYELSKSQRSNQLTLYLSKKRLAELFGVARTSLSRRLSDMEKRKLIEVRKTQIVLTPEFYEYHKKNFVNY